MQCCVGLETANLPHPTLLPCTAQDTSCRSRVELKQLAQQQGARLICSRPGSARNPGAAKFSHVISSSSSTTPNLDESVPPVGCVVGVRTRATSSIQYVYVEHGVQCR